MKNNIIIKYEKPRNVDIQKELIIYRADSRVSSNNWLIDQYYELNERFIGWTIVGKIEDNKLFIAYSICKYEEGDKFVKKLGVEAALKRCIPDKADIVVDLTDVPENETIKVFHGYTEDLIENIEKRFIKKRAKYWFNL